MSRRQTQQSTSSTGDGALSEYSHIKSLRERVYDHLDRLDDRATSAEDKMAAARWLKRHREIRTMADRANGFEDFVLAYVQKEQTRFRTDPDDHPHNGRRDAPLCMCPPSNCPLKSGELPREIDTAADVDVGIREFRKRHDGEPVVLTEARQQFADIMAAMEEIYTQAQIILTNGVDAPDEDVAIGKEARATLEVV